MTVFQGDAQVDASGTILAVRAGRRAEVGFGGGTRVGAAVPDEFDDWTLARDQRDDAAQSPRYVSPETTGYESLDGHGDWQQTPEYGPVWYPRAVPAGWAPYRAGRWAWVEPWGWTWIDEAPWGFAPFHYGRWALMRGAWCWVPGAFVARPVYAPALVGWIGRPGWSVTIGIGSVPAVGWFPLAPREAVRPGLSLQPGLCAQRERHARHEHRQRHQRPAAVRAPARRARGDRGSGRGGVGRPAGRAVGNARPARGSRRGRRGVECPAGGCRAAAATVWCAAAGR